MNISEKLLTTAKEMLLATENIKRLDTKVQSMSNDVAAIDRRLIRIETFIEIGSRHPIPAITLPTAKKPKR